MLLAASVSMVLSTSFSCFSSTRAGFLFWLSVSISARPFPACLVFPVRNFTYLIFVCPNDVVCLSVYIPHTPPPLSLFSLSFSLSFLSLSLFSPSLFLSLFSLFSSSLPPCIYLFSPYLYLSLFSLPPSLSLSLSLSLSFSFLSRL